MKEYRHPCSQVHPYSIPVCLWIRSFTSFIVLSLICWHFEVNSCWLFWLVDVLEEETYAAHSQEKEGPVDHPFKVLESGTEKKVFWNLELKKFCSGIQSWIKDFWNPELNVFWNLELIKFFDCLIVQNNNGYWCIPPRYECIVFTFLMQDFNGLQYVIPPRYEWHRFHIHNGRYQWFVA